MVSTLVDTKVQESTDADSDAVEVDAVIIGAGWVKSPGELRLIDFLLLVYSWSGLVAAKWIMAEGFKVVVLEKRKHFGGVWTYDEDPTIPTVTTNTYTTTSVAITEISDFPMKISPSNMKEEYF